jgi:hypothetical protein
MKLYYGTVLNAQIQKNISTATLTTRIIYITTLLNDVYNNNNKNCNRIYGYRIKDIDNYY